MSAFGPHAAAVAARRSDGLWTLADPEQAPEIIDAYRGACEDAGREPGEIILQAGFSWAEDDDAALEGSRVWKSTQIPDYLTDDWHDDDFKEAYIVSSDPEVHAERVRGRAPRRDRRLPPERVRRGARAGTSGVRGAGAAPPPWSAGLVSS